MAGNQIFITRVVGYKDHNIIAQPHTCDSSIGEVTSKVLPTCTEAGFEVTTYSCSICGKVQSTSTRTIAATGHTDNNQDGICDNCEEVVGTCTHSYTSVVTPPTATTQGYTTYTCSKCGHSKIDDYTDPTGTPTTEYEIFEGVALNNVAIKKSSSSNLSESTPQTDLTFVKFKPTKAGTYQFEATGGTYTDSIGGLYDSSKTSLLTQNDDDGVDNHFLFTYDCAANTTYYIAVKWYQNTASAGSVNLLVTCLSSSGGTDGGGTGTSTVLVTKQGVSTGDTAYINTSGTTSIYPTVGTHYTVYANSTYGTISKVELYLDGTCVGNVGTISADGKSFQYTTQVIDATVGKTLEYKVHFTH